MMQLRLSLVSLTLTGLHFCSEDNIHPSLLVYKRKLDLFSLVAVCHKMRPMGFSLVWLVYHLTCAVTETLCAIFIF